MNHHGLLGPVLGLALAAPAAALPTSCFVTDSDAPMVATQSDRQPVPGAGIVVLVPCAGSLKDGSAGVWLWFSPEEGKTQRRLVKPKQSFQEVLGNTPTVPLADRSTLWQRLYSALDANANPNKKPGFSRFDSKYGIQLGGSVLPGRDLRIPLAAFRWSTTADLILTGPGGKPMTLKPVDGVVSLPVSRMAPGTYTLVQGSLRANFDVSSPEEAAEADTLLAQIETETLDPKLKALRRAILLSEHGYVLNLVDEHDR